MPSGELQVVSRAPEQVVAVQAAHAGPMARPAQGGQLDMAKAVHGALRGHYLLVIVLGLMGGGGGGWLGWKYVQPVYKSEGLVRIASALPIVEKETDQNKPLAMFDTFMQSQKLLISSQAIMQLALQDAIWRGKRPDPQLIVKNLLVDIKPRSEYIQISVADTDPSMAAAAVTLIINVYAQRYNEEDRLSDRSRIGVLQEQQTKLQDSIRSLERQIREISLESPTGKLDPLCDAMLTRITKLQTALEDVQLAIVFAGGTVPAPIDAEARPTTNRSRGVPATQRSSQPAGGGAVAGTQPVMDGSDANAAVGDGADDGREARQGGGKAQRASKGTPVAEPMAAQPAEQIAMHDAFMAGLINERTRLEDALAQAETRGLGKSHAEVIGNRQRLDRLNQRIEKYADMYNGFRAATAQNLGSPERTPAATAGKSVDQLQQNHVDLQALLGRAKREARELAVKRQQLQQLEADLAREKAELAQKTARIESLTTEGRLGGRLSIVSTGEIPLAPDKDPRLKVAPIAAGVGALLPAGIIFLFGFLRHKRY